MTCEELMKKDVACVGMKDSAQSAARMMADLNIGFLPVVDEERQVLGTLTDRDIAVRLVAQSMPSQSEVKEIMSHEIVFCRLTDDVDKAARVMTERQKSRLLILDKKDRLVGVVSLSDVAEVLEPGQTGQTFRQIVSREVQA